MFTGRDVCLEGVVPRGRDVSRGRDMPKGKEVLNAR